ncbi:MAG TPA: non-homologous end-joining DNA ligase, partial [Flavisolibacter sp.]|nr:non-homologous end-joining DNA ligase [Flavisolibacter sp.]
MSKKSSQPGISSKEVEIILKEGKKSKIPRNIEPMLATLVAETPTDGNWIYEMKWDGYRAISYLYNGSVDICSRNNKSFNKKFYPIYDALQTLNMDAVLDGEIVVVNKHGIPDFSLLQQWRSEADGQLIYYVFDILWLNGINVMELSIEKRRDILKSIIPANHQLFRLSEILKDDGAEAFRHASKLQLEGVMAKKSGSVYKTAVRTKDWLKIKTEKHQELVIGGYTKNEGTNKLFSALLLGIMENGKFNFVTPVGTGFNKKMQQEIIDKLKPYEIKNSAFSTVPEYNKPSRFRPNPPKATVTWV